MRTARPRPSCPVCGQPTKRWSATFCSYSCTRKMMHSLNRAYSFTDSDRTYRFTDVDRARANAGYDRSQTFFNHFEAINDGCWLWRGPLNNGYARLGKDNAHRFSYELFRKPICEGFEIDHICHDSTVCKLGDQCPHRRCVNPWHMKVVTHAENTRRLWGR